MKNIKEIFLKIREKFFWKKEKNIFEEKYWWIKENFLEFLKYFYSKKEIILPIVIFFSILPQICIIKSIENNILTYLSFISFTQYFVDFSNILTFYIIFSWGVISWYVIRIILNFESKIWKIILLIFFIFLFIIIPIYIIFIEADIFLFFIFLFIFLIYIFIYYFKNKKIKNLIIICIIISYILINFYVYSLNNFWYACYDIEEKKCEKIYYKNDKYVFIKDENNKVKVVNISEMKVWKVNIKN